MDDARKHHSAVDKHSLEQKFHKYDVINIFVLQKYVAIHNSTTVSYG